MSYVPWQMFFLEFQLLSTRPGSYHLVTHIHYLSSCVSMKTKHSSECILTDGLWAVYFIPQDEDWDI